MSLPNTAHITIKVITRTPPIKNPQMDRGEGGREKNGICSEIISSNQEESSGVVIITLF
jgi:hypothetical protein